MERFVKVSFSCATCGEKTNAKRIGFDIGNIGAKIRCNKCKKGQSAKEWFCECRLAWYRCPLHSAAPRELRASRRKDGGGKKEKDDTKPEASDRKQPLLEQSLADQADTWLRTRSRKAAPDILIPSRAAALERLVQRVCVQGSLKRKFGHLNQTCGETVNTQVA